MRLLRLKIQAFGPYVSLQDLDFERELTGSTFILIHGATGAGKTTILDAICFALYGTASGEWRTGAMLRSDGAEAKLETFVEFCFALGDRRFRVWRRPSYTRENRKTKIEQKAELWRINGDDGEEEFIASRYNEVTEYIENLIGFAANQFRQVVLLPQGEFRRFLLANSKERGSIIEKMFRTEHYQLLEETLKVKASELERQTKSIREQERSIYAQEGVTGLTELIARQQAIQTELNEAAAKLAQLDKDKNAALDELNKAKRIEANFHQLEQAQRDLAAHLAKSDSVREFQEKLALADKAAPIMLREQYLEQSRRENVQLQQELDNLVRAHKDASEVYSEKKLALEQAVEVDKDRPTLIARVAELDKYHDRAISYQGLIQGYEMNLRDASAANQKLQELLLSEQTLQQNALMLKENLIALDKLNADESILKKELLSVNKNLEVLRELNATEQQLTSLDKALQESESKLAQLNRERNEAVTYQERLQLLFIEHSAARLAKGIKEGAPCPVCGSTTHPNLAHDEGIIPTEAELQQARNAAADLRKAKEEAQAKYQQHNLTRSTLIATRDSRQEQLRATDGTLLTDAIIMQQLTELQTKLAEVDEAKKISEYNIQELTKIEKELVEINTDIKNQKSACEHFEAILRISEIDKISAEKLIPEAYRNPEAVYEERMSTAEKVALLEEQLNKCSAAEKEATAKFTELQAKLNAAQKSRQEKARQLKLVEKDFEQAVDEAGFGSAEEYCMAIADRWAEESFRNAVRAKIADFAAETNRKQGAVANAAALVDGLAMPNLLELEIKKDNADKRWQDAVAEKVKLEADLNQLKKLIERIKNLSKEEQALELRYQGIGRMASVATAMSPYTMHFQTYIQRAILSDVLEAANSRLGILSRGRYQLCHGRMRDARTWQGLELEVYDEYTGKQRQAETLSGGEAFLTSLALALGLADVVHVYAGGLRLDTIFIDEGFGTLDSETLDLAIATLVKLQQESNRLVGIISHVEELKQHISKRLEIVKTAKGSVVNFSAS